MRKVAEPVPPLSGSRWAVGNPETIQRIAYLLLLTLGLFFTVEPRQAVLALGEVIQFSTVEVLLFALLGAWGLGSLLSGRLPTYPKALVLPIVLFWGSQIVATLFASTEQLTALKFCYRLTLGILTGWCAYDLLNTPHRWHTMLKALALGGAVVGVIGILEATIASGIADGFRLAVARVGDLERVSATLTYPTITALVLELTLPLLFLWMVEAPGRWQKIVLALLLLVGMITLILTLSRAGIALLGMIFVGLAVGAWSRERRKEKAGKTASPPRRTTTHPPAPSQEGMSRRSYSSSLEGVRGWVSAFRFPISALGAATTLGILTLVLLYFNPTARLRLVSETETEWYRATYESTALPTLKPGAKVRVPIIVTNTSPRPWEFNETQPFLLSYHLYRANGTLVTYDGARTLLDDPVAPGDQIEVSAFLFAPETPGEYLVAWDMLQEQVAWFSWKENNPYTMTLTVAGSPASDDELNITETPTAVVRIPTPTRFELWGVAFDMVRTNPWFGIGPDTFRLKYGYAMGYEKFDPHIHTNNQYIEFLVGSGVIGLAGFLAFSAVLALHVWRTVQTQTGGAWKWHFTLALLLATWYIHGMVDSFWQFTPTYILFWLLAALALKPTQTTNEI
jgi:O-antigen ligase